MAGMSEERKKSVGQWVAGALVLLLVLYVLSFGPACWLCSRLGIWADVLPVVYRPILTAMHVDQFSSRVEEWRLAGALPPPLPAASSSPLRWYSDLEAGEGWYWYCVLRRAPDGEVIHYWVFVPRDTRL
jgi:hypothetical protein